VASNGRRDGYRRCGQRLQQSVEFARQTAAMAGRSKVNRSGTSNPPENRPGVPERISARIRCCGAGFDRLPQGNHQFARERIHRRTIQSKFSNGSVVEGKNHDGERL
jgi:hypothetical protein